MNGHQRPPIIRFGAFLTPLAVATALTCASAAPSIQPSIHTFPARGIHRPAVPAGTQYECNGPSLGYNCVVQTEPRIVVDFWGDFTRARDTYGVRSYVIDFVVNIGTRTTTYLTPLGQYGVKVPQQLCPPPVKGVPCIWNHKVPPPAEPTVAQAAEEAENAAKHFGAGFGFNCGEHCDNLNTNIIIVTQSGVKPFPKTACAYHSFYGDDDKPIPGGIVFSVVPYLPGVLKKLPGGKRPDCFGWSVNNKTANGWLDGMGIALSHEIAEAVTDPVQVAAGSLGYVLPAYLRGPNKTTDEISDDCQNVKMINIFSVGGLSMAAEPFYSNNTPLPTGGMGYCVIQK
jgi:hypothetical protein